MKNSLETRLGIFVALTMIVAFLLLEMVGGLEHFKLGLRLHALVDPALPDPVTALQAVIAATGLRADVRLTEATLEDVFVAATSASRAATGSATPP